MSTKICRLCLIENNLKPIFEEKEKYEENIIALAIATGLRVEPNDGLPQFICYHCTFIVNSALKLRSQSHRAEIKLISSGYKRNYNNYRSSCEETDVLNEEINLHKEESTRNNEVKENCAETREHSLIIIENEENFPTVKSFLQKEVCSTQNLKSILQCEESNLLNVDNAILTEENILHLDINIQSGDTGQNFENKSNDCFDFDGFKIQVELDRVSETTDTATNFKATKLISKQPLKNKGSSVKEKRAMYLSLVEGQFDPKGPVTCKVCKKTLSRWACFTNHAKIHLGFKFVCEFCAKSFISSTQLKRHCMSHHGMERELKCTRCSYLALDNAQLKVHERRVHTGVRPYICDECSASYFSRKCLIQHIESHRTTADIQCELCPSVFKSRRHLAKHRYSAHNSGRKRGASVYNTEC